MNPTLYDILGVPRDAGPDEIKRAWRDAADRFQPGTGAASAQFRLFNEAAEVLLDTERRRRYDEQLAGRTSVPEPAAAVEPPTATGGTDDVAVVGPAEAPAAPPRPWVTIALGVLALVLVATVAWLGLVTWDYRQLQADRAAQDAARTAPAAAERAAAAILSYDYRSLDADEKSAARTMTDRYRKQYTDTFDDLVRPSATKLRARVQADVKASAVVHADPHRVNVLLFVNQTTTSTAHSGEPQIALNRVQMAMVEQDGTWLVNDITSY